jgi:hypothetical protein
MSNSKPSRSIYTATPIPALKRKITTQCPDTVLSLMKQQSQELGGVVGVIDLAQIERNGSFFSSTSSNVSGPAVNGNTGLTDAIYQSSSSSAPGLVGGGQLPAGDPVAKKPKVVKQRTIPQKKRDYSNAVIYIICNSFNSIIFVGSTIGSLQSALKTKIGYSKNEMNTGSKTRMAIAMREHGAHKFYILHHADAPSSSKNELDFKKQQVINEFISKGKDLYNVANYVVVPEISGCEGVNDNVQRSHWDIVVGYKEDGQPILEHISYTDTASKGIERVAAITRRMQIVDQENGGDNSTGGGFLPIIDEIEEEEEKKEMGEMVTGEDESYQHAETVMCRHGTYTYYNQCMECDDEYFEVLWDTDAERHLRGYHIDDGTIEEIQSRINAYDYRSDEEAPVAPPNSTDDTEQPPARRSEYHRNALGNLELAKHPLCSHEFTMLDMKYNCPYCIAQREDDTSSEEDVDLSTWKKCKHGRYDCSQCANWY